jgi:hypothetical protein
MALNLTQQGRVTHPAYGGPGLYSALPPGAPQAGLRPSGNMG